MMGTLKDRPRVKMEGMLNLKDNQGYRFMEGASFEKGNGPNEKNYG